MDAGGSSGPPRGVLPFDPAESAALAMARARVLERIEHACRRSGRNPAEVRLVSVSKTVTAERLRAALAAGIATFGENRVAEALGKVDAVPGASWHLIGPLQSNKARRAVGAFAMIETIDSLELARRIDRLAGEIHRERPLPVLLQVNVDADPAKAGFAPDGLGRDLVALLALPNLDVRGLMTVGRLVGEAELARPTFAALRRLSGRLRVEQPGLGPELSMGMSDDYPVAVEEGATIVRVGRAIFGSRAVPMDRPRVSARPEPGDSTEVA